jgi:predicted YcjX-like family ATPase
MGTGDVPLSRPAFELPSRSSLRTAGASLRDALTPTVRLGVTGLSRAGKTVFITAMVRNLMIGGRLPFFTPEAEGRLLDCILEPQPDDAVPRFDYEAHLGAFTRNPAEWPESTRRISELRLTLSFRPRDIFRRMLGLDRLHVDIVDYPGEWLIDLALLDQSFEVWCREALRKAEAPQRAGLSSEWRDFAVKAVALPDVEPAAIEGARKFTGYLAAVKASEQGVGALTPGRFLMPGDLAGSPLLTFFPLDLGVPGAQMSPLRRLLEKRFESYKREVVKPFFRNHFLKLDRQIVLVDVLGALSRGPSSVADLEDAMTGVLQAFRPGASSWLSSLYTRRIDRVLFAATKADHVSRTSHDRLEAILMALTERAAKRVTTAGGDVRVMAISALRATREAEVKHGGETLPCIAGIPMPGEVVAGKVFDGTREAVVFPGDLPEDPQDALAHPGRDLAGAAATFIRFRPPRLAKVPGSAEPAPTPHIRLDRALDYLLGDWLP